MDHNMIDKGAAATKIGASVPGDRVMDDARVNAGGSSGSGSSLSDNADESALQNLNVRL